MNMRIGFEAPSRVKKVLAQLGRTEDIKFSPDNRRLAVSGFAKNKLLLLDVEIAVSAAGVGVRLTDYIEIGSAMIREPHGLFFLDDETLIVANRSGTVPILRLPSSAGSEKKHMLSPVQTVRGGVLTPGSISAFRIDGGSLEVLICNNFVHYVSRHVLDDRIPFDIRSNEVFLAKGLSIPDGVAVSHDGRWIAVSNHNMHNVFLYEKSPHLDFQSEPDGILEGIEYPHGLRFTPDGGFILVADAGAPCVHVYAKGNDGWKGTRSPCLTFRVMEDEIFMKGSQNPQEGGPKGIDIDGSMNVLVTTCEHQILAFFDLQTILSKAAAAGNSQSLITQQANLG